MSLLKLARARVLTIDPGFLVILAIPWMLFATGSNFVFDYLFGRSYIDPWVYFGFFIDLPAHIHTFGSTYYSSRLSWILPGYVAHKVFPPVVAAYVLHLGVYYAAVLSLYLTLKHTVGQRAALLSTVWMGCYSFFLLAAGWDYVDGAGLVYFLLTTLVLTYAAKRQRSWIWLILSGTLYGAMIYSQLFLIVLTPPLVLYYVAANREKYRYSLMRGSFFFGVGFLAISALLGAINYQFGGNFLFYTPSIRYAMDAATKPNPWSFPFRTWWMLATWLVFPSLAFLSSLAFLLATRRLRSERKTRLEIRFQLYFLSCALIFLFFELKGTPVLQLHYYASLLIPAAFLAVGAQISSLTDRLGTLHFAVVVCGTLAILIFTNRFQMPDSYVTGWLSSHALWLLVLPPLMGLALLLPGGGPSRAMALFIPCLAVALVNVTSSSWRVKDPTVAKSGFVAIAHSVEMIRSAELSGEVRFWYQLKEPMGTFYRSVASTYLWGFRLVNEQFPSLELTDENGYGFQLPKPNGLVAVLSTDTDPFREADLALSRSGLGAQLVAERKIQEGPLAWNMIFLKVQNWPFIESVRLTASGWPASIQLQSEHQVQQEFSLVSPEAHPLFHSDMNNSAEWGINRYGRSGGLNIQPNCFATGDACGLYSSGEQRDHLASPFATLSPAGRSWVFFSIWVKSREGSVDPRVVLQDERFDVVAEGEKLFVGKDGWILRGRLIEVQDAKQLRVVVTLPRGSSSLLDKAMLLQVSDTSLAKPTTAARPR